MINVLQRLAELDAKNPNVIKEEDNSYTGYGDPRFTKITPEYEGEGPGEVEVTIADPVASDYENNNEVMVPVTVSYVNGLDKHGRSENTIKKVINKNTGQEIPINDISEYDLYDIIHPALDQDVKDTQDHRRDDSYEESSLREGQNKMTKNVNECGMMGSMSQPRSPASINMTADSGAELTNMLRDIMQLAGLKQVGPADLGHEHEPAVVSAEPTVSVAKIDDEPTVMRSMLDKLNPGMKPDDEQKVDEWDYEPANATDVPPMNQDAMLNTGMHNQDPAGHPGAAKGRHLKNHPVASPESTYESLMSEYRKFLGEADNYNDAAARTAELRAATAKDEVSRQKWKDEANFHRDTAKKEKGVAKKEKGVAEGINKETSFNYFIDNPEYNPNDPNSSEDITLRVNYQIHDEQRATMTDPGKDAECEIISVVNAATGEDYSNKVDMDNVLAQCWDDHEMKQGETEGRHDEYPGPEGEYDGDPLQARADDSARQGQGSVYKPSYPGDKTGMSKSYAYDIKRTGPKGHLPEQSVAEADTMESMLVLAGLKK